MTNPYPDMTPSVQSSLAPPPAQPTPGAVESRVVAPAQTPPTDPAERLRWAYERAGIAPPAAGWNPAAGAASSSTAEYQRVHDIQVAAVEEGRAARAAEIDKRRVSMGLKPLTPQAQEASGPLPASVIGPETDPELAKEAKSDPVISGLEDRLAVYQRRVDAAGGKASPAVSQRIAALQKQAAARLKIVQGAVDAKRAEQA